MMNYSELLNKVNIEIPAEIKSAGDAANAYTDNRFDNFKYFVVVNGVCNTVEELPSAESLLTGIHMYIVLNENLKYIGKRTSDKTLTWTSEPLENNRFYYAFSGEGSGLYVVRNNIISHADPLATTKANIYTDAQKEVLKNELLDGAGPAYDTLKKLGTLIDEDTDAIDALEELAGNKVDKKDLESYATKSDVETAIKNIDIPEVDLSNYYTKEEIDSLLSNIQVADLSGTEDLIYE